MKQTKQKQKSAPKPVVKQPVQQPLLPWLIVAVLLVVTFVAYTPILSNEFTAWDDNDYVTENVYIKDMDGAKVKHILTTPVAYNFHPLTILSLGFNYYVSEFNPQSYYLTNLLLHLLNTALAFWFVFLLSNRNIHVAAFAAAIFALHPMHVESVAWIAERKDVLYAAFFIASLISYLYYLAKEKYLHYSLALLFAFLSMASKPAAIILPAVLLLLDYYKKGNINLKSLLLKLPFAVFALLFLYMTWIAQTKETDVINKMGVDNYFDKFFISCYNLLIYFVKFFVPFHLAAFHPYPDQIGLPIYLSVLGVAAAVAAIYFFKAKRKLLLFGMAFFLINLVLVLQFISIGSAMYAERYTYIPYFGLLFIIGMLAFDHTSAGVKKIAWVVIGLFSLSFTYITHERVKVWHNAETLWTDMIEKYPEHFKGYLGRGNYYAAQEDHNKAVADYDKAILYKCDYRAYTNRASVYTKLKMTDKAMEDLNYSLRENARQPEAYTNRAQLHKQLNRLDEALKDANSSIEIKPTYEAYFTRAAVYKSKEMYDKAVEDYTLATALSNDVSAFMNRGNVYFLKGDYDQAIADYNIVLQQRPTDAKTISNRASAYFQLNKFSEAKADLDRAIAMEPNTARHYATRSSVYEKLGDKQKALLDAQAAIERGFNMPADYLARIRN